MFSAVQQALPHRSGLVAWIGCLFVLMVVALTPQKLEASCGDYLHGADRLHFRQDANSVRLVPRSDGHPEDSATAPVSPKSRCSGPFCQQTPPVPHETPQPDHPRSSFKELCFERIVTSCIIEEWFRLRLMSDGYSETPDLSRIDRPPQAA